MKKIKELLAMLLVVLVILSQSSLVANAVGSSQIIDKVISIAENEVGYTASSSYSKYGEWYGYQGGWCTTFVIWSFYQAGEALDVSLYGKIVPNGGNCNSMISWFNNKGRYHTSESGYTPKRGDLVFFDWSGNGSSQHVGIVTGVSGSTIYTVEGNCSGSVKERKYTEDGSKPYNNISAIMGYGNPDYSSVSGNSSSKPETTKVQTTTTTTTTTEKPTTTTTTQHHTTVENTGDYTTEVNTEEITTTASTTQTTTELTTEATTESTTASNMPTDMKLHAPKYDLEIGDAVKLDYTLKPAKSQAVVGYFCDEENIIEIGDGGKITAIGEGTATVVVCANDEIYRQVDFHVTAESVSVTKHTGDNYFEDSVTELTTVDTERTIDQRLLEVGVNTEKLKSHKDNYIYPLGIVGSTALISVIVVLIRKAVIKKKNKID